MHATPQNKLHILITELEEVKGTIDALNLEYNGRRKGSKYHRELSTMENRQEALKKRIIELGGNYNIIVIKARVKGKLGSIFMTNISLQDAKDLIMVSDKTIQIVLAEEMAPKKWHYPR